MKKILIIVDTSRAARRKFLAGAERYISIQTGWEVYIQPPAYLQTKNPKFDFGYPLKKLDGLLISSAVDNETILKVDVPKVVYSAHREVISEISTIITDSANIGQLAADYFVGLGFEHYAFCGFRGFAWSQKRREAFKKTVLDCGAKSFSEFADEQLMHYQGEAERKRLSQWLAGLPHPVCVFACNDDRAFSVLEACKIAQLSVPEEVAVLGVDNDELMCNISFPPLSSMELDFERTGFAAAEHLDELIQKKCGNEIIPLPAGQIIQRRSTDTLVISDERVVAALIFIRNNFHKPIQLNDVANAAFLSKRELQKRFKKFLKRNIKDEIRRLRIDFVKRKLLNSHLSIAQIANGLEFIDSVHFSRYFKKATGQTPLQFRRQH